MGSGTPPPEPPPPVKTAVESRSAPADYSVTQYRGMVKEDQTPRPPQQAQPGADSLLASADEETPKKLIG